MGVKDYAILQKKWWSKRRIFFVTLFFVICIPLAVVSGLKQNVRTDFHVFWYAGKNFFQGLPLYVTPKDGSKFLYPPFSAFLFQPLAFFPLKFAGGLFYVFNALLYAASIYFTKEIFKRFYPDRNSLTLPLVFAVILSAQFFFMNLNAGQVNGLVFVLCLLGIHLYLTGRSCYSGIIFVVAAFLKITPVFFVGWLVIRCGKKVIRPIAVAAILCLAIPLLFRGVGAGINDLSDFYHVVIQPFQEGAVDTSFQNQNAAGTIYRMTLPSTNSQNYNYQYLPLSVEAAAAIYKIFVITILALFGVFLVFRKLKNTPVMPLEISFVFLTGHLLSGITWKAHLVTLLFIFTAFFTIGYSRLSNLNKSLLFFLYSLIVFTGSTGKDIVGSKLHFYIGGFSIIAWTLLLLFFGSVWFSAKESNNKIDQ